MANGWTPERRARQAEAIRKWRPWERSTGPRSPNGKAQSALNANQGGVWRDLRQAIKDLNEALREQRKTLKDIREEE